VPAGSTLYEKVGPPESSACVPIGARLGNLHVYGNSRGLTPATAAKQMQGLRPVSAGARQQQGAHYANAPPNVSGVFPSGVRCVFWRGVDKKVKQRFKSCSCTQGPSVCLENMFSKLASRHYVKR